MVTRAMKHAMQHGFSAELRIKVSKKIYPNITQEEVMELAQRVMEGESVPGIIVQRFEVRGEDKTDEVSKDYDFAAGLMRSAERTEENTGASKKGKKRNK